jgi:hypothetical protein
MSVRAKFRVYSVTDFGATKQVKLVAVTDDATYKAGIPLEMSIGYEAIIKKWIDDDKDRVSFGHYRDLIVSLL